MTRAEMAALLAPSPEGSTLSAYFDESSESTVSSPATSQDSMETDADTPVADADGGRPGRVVQTRADRLRDALGAVRISMEIVLERMEEVATQLEREF